MSDELAQEPPQAIVAGKNARLAAALTRFRQHAELTGRRGLSVEQARGLSAAQAGALQASEPGREVLQALRDLEAEETRQQAWRQNDPLPDAPQTVCICGRATDRTCLGCGKRACGACQEGGGRPCSPCSGPVWVDGEARTTVQRNSRMLGY